jgi:hypothetical protein
VSRNKSTRVGDDNPKLWGPVPDAPGSEQTRVGDTNPSLFGRTSPRSREDHEPGQGDVGEDRRDHDDTAPSKGVEGAIDRKGNRDRRGRSRARGSRS